MPRLLAALAVVSLSVGLTGCLLREMSPPVTAPATAIPADLRFTAVVPVEVRLGDNSGAPIDGHVSADRGGVPITQFSFSPGKGVVLKSYPVAGLPGAGQLRVYAPLGACRSLRRDSLHVVATASDGSTAETELPVVILGTDPGSSEEERQDTPVPPPGRHDTSIVVTSPAAGARLSGVVHQVSGTATGLTQVALVVISASGEYQQGGAPVVGGRWTLPVYLGDSKRGIGESFRIFAAAPHGDVSSNRVRVIRAS